MALPRGGGGGALRLAAVAVVDGAWGAPPAAQPVSPPAARPQTHLANARTDGGWSHEANGRRVQGQLEWRSEDELEVVAEPWSVRRVEHEKVRRRHSRRLQHGRE